MNDSFYRHIIQIPARFDRHPLRARYLAGWAQGYLGRFEKHQTDRAREAKKVSHVDAEYKEHGTAARHCSVCSMYEGPNKCSAVRSPISPAAICKLFDPKKQPESRVAQRLRRGV